MNLKQMARLLVPMLAVAVLVPLRAASAAVPLALVIGNGTYAALPPLPACIASAHMVTAALKRAGFDVTEQIDRSNGQMGADLAALMDSATRRPGSSAVIYICGYAVGFNNRPFLLPVSATIDRDTDVLTQGLVAKSVPDALARGGVTAGLVAFDAVAPPAGSGKLSFDGLSGGAPSAGIALAAASADTPPPQGVTPLAAALAASLTTTDIEAGALLTALQQRLAGVSATRLAVLAPAGPVWLAGGPAPVVPPPAPAPVPAPAPLPPAAPPLVPAPIAPVPVAPVPAPSVVITVPDEEHMTVADRRRIQAGLLRLGYYSGQVDGIFGADTRAAIRRFQHEIGADMTGRITPEQAGRLLADSR